MRLVDCSFDYGIYFRESLKNRHCVPEPIDLLPMKEGWEKKVLPVKSQGHVVSTPLYPQNWLGREHSVVRSGSGNWGGDREFDWLCHCLFGVCGWGAHDKCASRLESKACGAVGVEMISEWNLSSTYHLNMHLQGWLASTNTST